MKLFRRTHWKPKQNLQRKDIQILLTEYRVSKNSFHVSVSLIITLATIAVASFGLSLAHPERKFLGDITGISGIGALLLSIWALYFRKRALQIAKVLGIEKCLDKYGIEKTL